MGYPPQGNPAISDYQVAGLLYKGDVTAVPLPNQFTIPTLKGLGAGLFADATAPYQAFVARTAGGAGAAPQGQMQPITGYVDGTGVFTAAPFTVAVGIGDLVMIVHPRLAEVLKLVTSVGDPSAHTLKSLVAKWGNTARSLALILGTRWDAAGDVGTDIALILAGLAGGGGPLTTFSQETAAATAVNGVAWKDLLDKSVLAKPTKIIGFIATVAGGWAGKAQIRIVTGAGVKIWPLTAEVTQDTDWASGVQQVLGVEVVVPAATGYKVQFRSSNGADGAGKTLQLNNLDVLSLG